MKIEDAFILFKQYIEKNAITDKIASDKPRFVNLFNVNQLRLLAEYVRKKNNDDVRHIQNFLVLDYDILRDSMSNGHCNFKLPNDFFIHSNVRAFGGSKGCSNQEIFCFEIKAENVNEVLADDFNKPSFFHRESPYRITSDNLIVYVDDFIIDKIALSYYRYPVKVQLSDTRDINGSLVKESIDPEFSDYLVEKIVAMCAESHDINEDDLNKYNFNKDRVLSNN